MPEFRLTQISDPHLARRLPKLTENFHRVSEHISATRPDLVIIGAKDFTEGQILAEIVKQTIEANTGLRAEIKRISINASRDVIVHSFDKDKMRELVQDIYSTGIAWKADFIAQSEQSEIRLADKQTKAAEASMKELSAFLADKVPEADVRNWATEHVRVFFDVDEWFNVIKTYDFVFGSRFHGCMIALQRGVPAIVICHDTRTEDMCRFLGMPYVSIVDLKRISVDELYSMVNAPTLNARYAELYPMYSNFLKLNRLVVKP